MPIINPVTPSEFRQVLREARWKGDPSSLQDLLNEGGLSLEETVETVGSVMRGADTSAARLKAAEMAFKLHGVMNQEEVSNVPIVNIIINDVEHLGINPILVPREML